MKVHEFIRRLLPLSGAALVATLSLAHAQDATPATPPAAPAQQTAPVPQTAPEPQAQPAPQPQPAPQAQPAPQTQPAPAPQTTEYEPSVGQEGKDVVWVPTSQAVVDKMLDMAKVTDQDYQMDLGSGDGRTVISAAKRGAKATGIEYNPDMVELAKRNAAKAGVTDKATFVKADLFATDFSKATVLTLFLLPDINLRLRPKILKMKPGVRVVSNSFDMGDWTPDEKVTVSNGCSQFCTALFWIVPAKVQGKWKMPNGEFVVKQEYQNLSGTLKAGKVSGALKDGKMTGDKIAFSVGDTNYTGQVVGNTIKGTSKSPAGETEWRATRVY